MTDQSKPREMVFDKGETEVGGRVKLSETPGITHRHTTSRGRGSHAGLLGTPDPRKLPEFYVPALSGSQIPPVRSTLANIGHVKETAEASKMPVVPEDHSELSDGTDEPSSSPEGSSNTIRPSRSADLLGQDSPGAIDQNDPKPNAFTQSSPIDAHGVQANYSVTPLSDHENGQYKKTKRGKRGSKAKEGKHALYEQQRVEAASRGHPQLIAQGAIFPSQGRRPGDVQPPLFVGPGGFAPFPAHHPRQAHQYGPYPQPPFAGFPPGPGFPSFAGIPPSPEFHPAAGVQPFHDATSAGLQYQGAQFQGLQHQGPQLQDQYQAPYSCQPNPMFLPPSSGFCPPVAYGSPPQPALNQPYRLGPGFGPMNPQMHGQGNNMMVPGQFAPPPTAPFGRPGPFIPQDPRQHGGQYQG